MKTFTPEENARIDAQIAHCEHLMARRLDAASAMTDRLADLISRSQAVLDFAMADVPQGGRVPPVLTELEYSVRFAKALLAPVQS